MFELEFTVIGHKDISNVAAGARSLLQLVAYYVAIVSTTICSVDQADLVIEADFLTCAFDSTQDLPNLAISRFLQVQLHLILRLSVSD